MLLIKKTYSRANQPPLGEYDLAEKAVDWTNSLIKIIPENRLWEAFDAADLNHPGSFPINYYELKTAYEQILEQEVEAKRQIALAAAMENERDYNSPFWKPCGMCFGCGFTETSRTDEFGRDYKGVIKCYSCNYWELYKQKHGL